MTIIAYGGTLAKALTAAEELSRRSVDAEVIDLRVLRPLDEAALVESVTRTHRAVLVDEGWRSGSLSAEISARLVEQAFYDLDAPIERVCSAEVPMPYAPPPGSKPRCHSRLRSLPRRFGRWARMPEFRMPSLGADMDAGTLLEWLVKPGDPVHRGDVIAVVDTDKAAIEVECFEDGLIDQLIVEPGQKVPVGTVLASIAAPGAAPPAIASAPRVTSPLVRHLAKERGVDLRTRAGDRPPRRLLVHRADVDHLGPPPTKRRPAGVRASPLARRLAASAGLDLSTVTGTGAGGAIGADDVRHVLGASNRLRNHTGASPNHR